MSSQALRTLIIEDEKPSARRLSRMLDKLGVEVTTLLHSVSESIEWFEKNDHPDLMFLDIQLSDGLSFEIFDRVQVKSAIIFTTAYDEYALQAFKLNSIDYLLKPIDEEIIIKASKETDLLITVEDHSVIGGLGSAVSEVLTQHNPSRLVRIGLNDELLLH